MLERPAFRALVETHRCLLPAEGFYEWRTNEETGKREPFDVTIDDGMFAFAGLWAARKDEQADEWIRSCTIITTRPNELARLHDRMPVILPRAAEADWLDPDISIEHAMSLLEPYPAEHMRMRAASPLVNSVKNEGPELLEAGAGTLF